MQETLPAAAAPGSVPGWLLVLHVLGVLGYAGGLLALSRLLVLAAGADASLRAGMAALGRRVYLTVALPAAAAAFGTGIYFLVADPAGKHYFQGHNGYMHMKLTLVAILMIVDHLLVLRPLKDLARGAPRRAAAPSTSPATPPWSCWCSPSSWPCSSSGGRVRVLARRAGRC